MIRSPLALRLDASAHPTIRETLREAAGLGVRGVVLEALGDLSPDRLSESGRRDLRHALRSAELSLAALVLPTRRPFDTDDQLEDRLHRASRAFAMAFELGTRLVLVRAGTPPPESDAARRAIFTAALDELAHRAERQGIRLALELGGDPPETLRPILQTRGDPNLAASVDPLALLAGGQDPVVAVRDLAEWLAHAYATDASTAPTTVLARPIAANPRGFGFAPGVLDWEEFLGALEEIAYSGFLTIWPDLALPMGLQVRRVIERLQAF